MKLAEALVERKALQERVGELNERLQRVILVQEGSEPVEQPSALLDELDRVTADLARLISAINKTNNSATISTGETITDAIARRDVLRMTLGVYDAILSTAGNQNYRSRGAEIKMLVTVDVSAIQATRDRLARKYRELDTALQSANWAVELVLEAEG